MQTLPFVRKCALLNNVGKLNMSLIRRTLAVSIKSIIDAGPSKCVTAKGWVTRIRKHQDVTFINLSDGSTQTPLQLVVSSDIAADIGFGSSVAAHGELCASRGKGQAYDLETARLEVIGPCDTEAYPLKIKQDHTADYLRNHLHLRPRAPSFASFLRLRNAATQASHAYLQQHEFCEVNTPILTTNDCEGAGEVFQVQAGWEVSGTSKPVIQETSKPATQETSKPATQEATTLSSNPATQEANTDAQQGAEHASKTKFFSNPTYLTVSGQLHLEAMSNALSKVYTFGPTFRAENSHTRNHLCEFYMLEAEIVFTDSLDDIMEVIEGLLKHATRTMINSCPEDFKIVTKSTGVTEDPWTNMKAHVDNILDKDFVRMTYTEAIDILEKHKKKIKLPVKWGNDLSKEHERKLVRHCGNVPVFVTDYPAQLKAFYARQNEDGCTVAGVDLLYPGVGEVCGGSLREERLDYLEKVMQSRNLADKYDWYLDLRRFGSVPHGGFGIGFERFLQALLGIHNIKDTLPFPRVSHSCHY